MTKLNVALLQYYMFQLLQIVRTD